MVILKVYFLQKKNIKTWDSKGRNQGGKLK